MNLLENTVEEWRPVLGFPHYEVSDRGQIRSLDRWSVHPNGRRFFLKGRIRKPYLSSNGYYCVYLPDKKHHRIHRLMAIAFLGCANKNHVDHADGNKLNNLLSNLRPCTKSQNQANMGKPKTNTSGFKGVSWSKQCGKWVAYIKCNGKRITIGYFATREEAAQAYDAAAIRFFGEFALTNSYE